MIELIKASAVPATILRAAARGALSLPASEMVEILVFLTDHPAFGPRATSTLAAWDEDSLTEIAADPNTPPAVLKYLSESRNLIPAAGCQPENLEPVASADQPLDDAELSAYVNEHAEEIKAAETQPFSLFGWTAEEQAEVAGTLPESEPVPPSPAGPSTVAAAAAAKPEKERGSTIQKIARLSVGERVQLALKGNKDERFVLIRDGVKVVCNAVIDSPKVTDSEVEMFASMKNVNESVLRAIASKRKFIKSYAIIRILTSNPRCPIDISVPLLSHLLTLDLKYLSANKNVAETVRKMSLKIFRDRLTRNG
jgi:hypothetical protein